MVAAVAHVARRRLQDQRLNRIFDSLEANRKQLLQAYRKCEQRGDWKGAGFFLGQCSGMTAAMKLVAHARQEEIIELQDEFQDGSGVRRTDEVEAAGGQAATSAARHTEAAGTPSVEGAAGGWRQSAMKLVALACFASLFALVYLLRIGE